MKTSLLAATAVALFACAPASALTITLNNLNTVTPGTDAYNGFRTAANFWETIIKNDVNVTLNVGYSALPAGVLGSTGSTTNVAYVGDVFNAMAASKGSALDKIAVANLNPKPSTFIGGAAIDALISAPKANGSGVALPLTRVADTDRSANNSAFSANTSLMKALGLTPTYAANNPQQADGTVQFSTGFAFDFDPTNGIASNQIDFIGVAIHEIGHALGFRSGVDVYDGNVNFTGNLNGFAIMSIWDTFRFSTESAALGINDWAIGGTGTNAPYFSIDGGQTIFQGDAFMSTGRANGDGRQASHWKDNAAGQGQLGMMDPTVAYGQMTIVDNLDIAAFDAMGWNVNYDVLKGVDKEWSSARIASVGGNFAAVPEPTTWAMMIIGFGLVGGTMRRRGAVAA